MCGSMADIQSPAAEIRPGKKERKNKLQQENIMVYPIPYGDHKNCRYAGIIYPCNKLHGCTFTTIYLIFTKLAAYSASVVKSNFDIFVT